MISPENQPRRWRKSPSTAGVLYSGAAYAHELAPILQRAQELKGKSARTAEEEEELGELLQSYSGRFLLGRPFAYGSHSASIRNELQPLPDRAGDILPLTIGVPWFWGVPTLINRLLQGIDPALFEAIVQSGKWGGTPEELLDLVQPFFLNLLPDICPSAKRLTGFTPRSILQSKCLSSPTSLQCAEGRSSWL